MRVLNGAISVAHELQKTSTPPVLDLHDKRSDLSARRGSTLVLSPPLLTCRASFQVYSHTFIDFVVVTQVQLFSSVEPDIRKGRSDPITVAKLGMTLLLE